MYEGMDGLSMLVVEYNKYLSEQEANGKKPVSFLRYALGEF